LAEIGARGVQQGSGALYHHARADLSDLQDHIHGGLLLHIEPERTALVFLEPDCLYGERVCAGGQRREHVSSKGIGHCAAFPAAVNV
jgi:hypothetical protein